MLRISQISPATARHYLPGHADTACWNGQAAIRLGLHGTVTPGQLDALWGWRHPMTDVPLIPAPRKPLPDKDMPRPAGYLFGFSPSRTLAVHDDQNSAHFQKALQASAEMTLHAVEAESETWHLEGHPGSQWMRRHTTGNLLWMTPLRDEPRPGRARQPYASCFVFNLTWDPLEERWKSLRLATMKQHRANYQQAFYDALTDRLNAFNPAPSASP